MLRHVAGPRGRAAHRARGLEGIGGAHGARSGTGLVHVAVTRGGPAHRSAVPGRVLAVVAAAIALVAAARVAVGRARRPGRGLRVRRAVGAVPRAVLRRVARARRGAALDEGRHEAVRRAGRARAGAGLVHVAEAGGGAADRPGVARRVLAVVAAAVALVAAARVAVVGARRPRRRLRIRRAVGTVARTAVRRVTLARRGAAHRARGLEGVGGTDGARAGAGLVHVAEAGGGAADRPGVPRRVLAVVAAAVALVEAARIAVVGARRPGRRLGVRRAAGTRAGAVIVRVALARRGAAHDARRLEGVDRTHGTRPGAGLVHIAEAGGGTADGPGVPRRVLAVVAAAVALVEAARIAVVGARRPRRSLGVRRAAGARAGAVLARITLSRRGAADRGRRLESVRRARRARAGAGLVDVAEAGGRPADCPGVPRRVLAVAAAAVALVKAARIAVARTRGTGRGLGVRRAGGARAGTLLGRITLSRRAATNRARRLEGVRGAHGARSGACLVQVAGAGRRAAHRPGVARRMLACHARPVALVRRARIAVGGARRPARRFGVGRAVGSVAGAVLRRIAFARRDTALRARGCKPIGRAGRARAGARLRDVATTGRPAAHRSGVACGVLSGRARPVALVRGAGIAVGSACRPRGLRGVGRAGGTVAGAVLREVAFAGRGAAHGGRRLEAVRGTGGARARARLCDVATPGGRAAHRPRVPGRVLAGHARPVALIERARVAVRRAC